MKNKMEFYFKHLDDLYLHQLDQLKTELKLKKKLLLRKIMVSYFLCQYFKIYFFFESIYLSTQN